MYCPKCFKKYYFDQNNYMFYVSVLMNALLVKIEQYLFFIKHIKQVDHALFYVVSDCIYFDFY